MVRRIAALIMALSVLLMMSGFAEGDPGATPVPTPAAADGPEAAMETEMPTEKPTAEPTEEPEEPTEEPTAEPTKEPEGPTDEPTAEPTKEPEGPTEEPTDEPTTGAPMPTIDPTAEAWMEDGDGLPVSGTLDELIKRAADGAVINILAEMPVCARDVKLDDIKNVVFAPDPDKYDQKKYVCRVSDIAPEGCQPPEGCEFYIFVWVEMAPAPTAAPTDKPTPRPELEIRVEAENYVPGKWSCQSPVFTLSGIPEGSDRYAYAVVAYDERFIILSGNTYTVKDEGEYDLRFVILDGIGDVVAKSAKYTPQLDFTSPYGIYVQMKEGSNKKYQVYAEDAGSGIEAYSNDGGETWKAPDENGVATFKGKGGDIISAGMIMARDGAGNIAIYEADFIIPAADPGMGGGGGGGGGGGEPTPPHAPLGDETGLNPYNALELTLPEGPMSALVMGETELPLTLKLDIAQDFEVGADYQAQFTARLAKWGPKTQIGELEDGEEYDTLVLTVEDDPLITGEYGYMFKFNGVVYRMLQNSGIDYLALATKDGCAAISTAGFTAGTEYTRMKAEGVSTKKMEYSVLLTGDGDEETPVQMAMELEVETETGSEVYPLVDEASCETGEMYYYDVQTGPMEMMDVPFGAWMTDGAAQDGTDAASEF